MSYFFNKTVTGKSVDQTIEDVTAELKKEGFGVLTEIDVKETLKKKLDVDFKKYKILGACNPSFAHQALQNGDIEVSAVDPVESMSSVKNDGLSEIAAQVRDNLKKVIDNLN